MEATVPDATHAIDTIVARLRVTYPNATYELDWETPEQMLVATILAAQCTDERVNKVTRTLFKKYPSPEAYANAPVAELESDLKPTGFYRQKTKTVQTVCRELVQRFDSKVPKTMGDLVSIKGIARKTANVVLNCCFDIPSGVIVDTHVHRVSQRMGLSKQKKADKCERDLMRLIPQDEWTFYGPAMVLHGRYVCKAKAPDCARCVFNDVCPRNGVKGPKPALQIDLPDTSPAAVAAARAARVTPGAATAGQGGGIDPWLPVLQSELDKPYFGDLITFVDSEREKHQIFPPEEEVFTAFSLTSLDTLKVLILGQDPYHDVGQAHGLSFSVKDGIKPPPSLKNMYKELKADVGITPPKHGNLSGWAEQGVMMLNAVLTVRAHTPNSHKNKGWEKFTDAVIRAVSDHCDHVVFVLWGKYAKKKTKLIDAKKHTILATAHPSPLSAKRGFFGSKPYSKINAALTSHGQTPINWGAL